MTNCSLSLDSILRTFTPATHIRTLTESKFWGEYRGVSKLRSLYTHLLLANNMPRMDTLACQSEYDNHAYKVRGATHRTVNDKQLSSANPLSPHALSSQQSFMPTLYLSHRTVNDKLFSSVICLSLHVLPSQRPWVNIVLASQQISRLISRFDKPSTNIGYAISKPQTKSWLEACNWQLGHCSQSSTPTRDMRLAYLSPANRDIPWALPRDVWS